MKLIPMYVQGRTTLFLFSCIFQRRSQLEQITSKLTKFSKLPSGFGANNTSEQRGQKI